MRTRRVSNWKGDAKRADDYISYCNTSIGAVSISNNNIRGKSLVFISSSDNDIENCLLQVKQVYLCDVLYLLYL